MDYSIMEQQLNGEYRDAFTAVITYGTLKNYSDEIMTERIAELFDTLLTAQTNGKPVGKIIGHNTERFCREFFEDCSNWDMTVKFLQSLFYMSCITFVLVLLLYLTDRGSADGARYNLTPCIIGAAIYFIFSAVSNLIIVPLMFKSPKIKPAVWHRISLIVFFVIFITALILGSQTRSRIYIPESAYLICSGAYIAVYFIIRSVIRYRKNGSILKAPEDTIYIQNNREFNDKKYDAIVIKTWKKQYDVQYAKGKTDPGKFIEKLKKNNSTSRKMNILTGIAVISVYGVSVFQFASDGNITATIIFSLICGVICYKIWKFFIGALSSAQMQNDRLISECESSGLPFPEFAEKILNPDCPDTILKHKG
ncbi:MAG: hypothetical protein IKM72_01380 [Oscillospiraceae bacterium]|nr:hypothetical protein [Oscillospiraceae bacterium]